MAAMGITRLASTTGLDRVGIPVCAAVRPNSRSVSVAQGKGATVEAAAVSALMEAAEVFHAEDVDGRAHAASCAELDARGERYLLHGLGRTARPLGRRTRLRWIEGFELRTGSPCWVPLELVSTDYRLPRAADAGLFAASTNGLASGNHLVEAAISGLCELVERDAAALWAVRGWAERAGRRVDPLSVGDASCLDLVASFLRAGLTPRLWDMTTDIGIPAFLCRVSDPRAGAGALPGVACGYGCHPDRGVALARALLEAAQSRLTRIAGARDDLGPDDYTVEEAPEVWEALLDLGPGDGPSGGATPRRFAAVPTFGSDDLAQDLAWLLERLEGAGLGPAVAVDLTDPRFGIPVLRLVVPGLEGVASHPDYRPGRRAKVLAGTGEGRAR